MALRQKKQRKILSVAEKTTVKIIALHSMIPPAAKKPAASRMLLPPLTQFNMGYFKEKDGDPL